MLEDYTVKVRLPIGETAEAPGVILGTGFGLNADESSGAVWYSDGQDMWLSPSQPTIYAMFRGQVRFVPNGSLNLNPPSEPGTPPSSDELSSPLLPAMGDCLVLDLWPQDFLKLSELFPDPLLVPKRIVYQNVDRNSAVEAAAELIERHIDHYKRLFQNEEDTELPSEAVVAARAQVWLESKWIAGSPLGVYVDPGDAPAAIGETAPVPLAAPDGLPDYARVDHGTPATAIGFRRLTLKVLNEQDQLIHPAFLFYLLARTEDDAMAINWTSDSAFIRAQNSAVADLTAVRVTVSEEEDETATFEPDPPPAYPNLYLQIKHSSIPVWIKGLYDPFEQPEEGRWRFQSKLPLGEYEDSYDGPPLLLAQRTRRRITVPEETQRELHPASIEEILRFDLACFQTALAAVSEEEIVDLLRGPTRPDGTRATREGLYFRYNIPDSVGVSGDSWRSWEEDRPGTGVGGGWYLARSSHSNWLDFYVSPTDRPGGGNLLVWSLITHLREGSNADRVLEQYRQACNQYARARSLVRPAEDCVELSLALVATYRQFGDQIFDNRGEVNSFEDGGLDNLGAGLPGPGAENVGHGMLPYMRHRRYIRRETFEHIRPELTTTWTNENTEEEDDPNSGQPVIPAIIRRDEIIEIYAAVLNWNRDSVYSRLRNSGVYPGDFELRAGQIWTRAAISTIGRVRRAISRRDWRTSTSRRAPERPAGDANNVFGNDILLDEARIGTHAFRKGHVSAAEAEIMETLVFRRARDCMARRPPMP